MVQIFTTGGTIDKVYFDAQSDYEIGEPQIGQILSTAGVGFEYAIKVVLRKDSLELTDEDRDIIAHEVTASEASQIIVTHGTDTMVDTARAIEQKLDPALGKAIVLVGALAPARFRSTDAEFNIGFAAAAVQTLPPGVYITMNGRVFSPSSVRKNRAQNRFEEAS